VTRNQSRPVPDAVLLCAGRGNRLGDLTETIPKTLLETGEGTTILDRALGALASIDIARATLVVGHAAEVVAGRVAAMERRHGLTLTLVDNPHHASRNNAYSLALGLAGLDRDVLVVNGDTLFEVAAPERLAAVPPAPVTLAVDRVKTLGAEEMKVLFDPSGSLVSISKALDTSTADGEYIGLSLISRGAIGDVVAALEGVWTRDPALYYEDGFGDLAAAGMRIAMVDVGDLPWIEVDTPEDLERARMMSWRS